MAGAVGERCSHRGAYLPLRSVLRLTDGFVAGDDGDAAGVNRVDLSALAGGEHPGPGQTLHLILDNFSPHKHPSVRAWCQANHVELVFLPTDSSWLNWIEAEFAAPRYFALNGTDHRTHAEQDAAIGDYIRWHNQRAKPKTGYATNSKIRHPDYPFKAA